MALRIRLQRHGRKANPVYRLVVTENLAPRDGKYTELLGTYAPRARGQDKELNLKLERIEYWKSVGAKPTDTARGLINRWKRENPEGAEAAASTEAAAA